MTTIKEQHFIRVKFKVFDTRIFTISQSFHYVALLTLCCAGFLPTFQTLLQLIDVL